MSSAAIVFGALRVKIFTETGTRYVECQIRLLFSQNFLF